MKSGVVVREGRDSLVQGDGLRQTIPGPGLNLDGNETRVMHEERDYLERRYPRNAKSILTALG